ncbi:MAG: ABC transporter ATP-binding protein [Betaproteobacteria bacterium]|nr:ABC transporter ATP-binding protein [Betaproteobacteria bacterium]
MLRLERLIAGHTNVPVVHDVSLSVEKAEVVALLGPNGAGKSTLLAAIVGTLSHRTGRVALDDEDIVHLPSHEIVQRGVALVPEGRLVFSPFSVADNLRLGAIRLAGGRAALRERFDYVYELFPRLAERHTQAAGTLSGGEQQMLAVGRALMSKPRLLLLDEPFLGLAPLVVVEIRRALERLRETGLTIFIVEQKLDIALAFAQRVYVLIKGHVVLHESTAALACRSDLDNLYFSLAMASTS